MYRPQPIRPDRLRTLERPYSWVPFRLLSSGRLAELSRPAKLLYFLLCLVADRRGLSFYGDRRMHELLALSDQELCGARTELCDRDLLAFDGRVYQLLSWPAEPAHRPAAGPRCPVADRGGSPGGRPLAQQRSERSRSEPLRAVLQRLELKER